MWGWGGGGAGEISLTHMATEHQVGWSRHPWKVLKPKKPFPASGQFWSVKLAMGSTIDIQLCIGRHSLRISSYEIDIQLCIQLIIRGIKEYRAVRSTFSSAFKIKHTLNIELWVRHSALHSKSSCEIDVQTLHSK